MYLGKMLLQPFICGQGVQRDAFGIQAGHLALGGRGEEAGRHRVPAYHEGPVAEPYLRDKQRHADGEREHPVPAGRPGST